MSRTKDDKTNNYYYADSDTTDPNFTDLTPIGEGVYKNKFGKIVYDTTKVTPPEKDKSINDNWQTAYAKGVPSGTMSADMETMNAVTGGGLNLISPSQIVGAAIHSYKPQDYFLNLLKGNSGIVTDKFAQEHPYLSMAANGAVDAFTGRTLYNINYWNQTRPLLTSIGKGIGKTIVEVPYNIITNKNVQTYGRKIVNPILDYGRDVIHPIETIKAIKDGRYTPLFLNTAKARSAFAKNLRRLQNQYDDAYNFNKEIEANKSFPINVDEQYKINIDNWNNADGIKNWQESPSANSKPRLHIDPLKDKKGQKFYGNDGYYVHTNDVHIPSRTSKHILTDPNSFKTRLTLSHESNHHMQDIIPRYRIIGVWNDGVEYYIINPDDELASKVFKPIKHNSSLKFTSWSGSPYEAQSEMAGLQYVLNNPSNYASQPLYNKLFMNQHMSRKFNIFPWQTHKMLNDMSKYSFAKGGKFNK